MKEHDPLRVLLIEFFQLPADTKPEQLTQPAVAKWDSFAMVQLITELQSAFSVEFGFDEVDRLTSYAAIREILSRRGAKL
jgi:acyl carrier protein